jgi:hypothetical protein
MCEEAFPHYPGEAFASSFLMLVQPHRTSPWVCVEVLLLLLFTTPSTLVSPTPFPSRQAGLMPINFVTIATPHLGSIQEIKRQVEVGIARRAWCGVVWVAVWSWSEGQRVRVRVRVRV